MPDARELTQSSTCATHNAPPYVPEGVAHLNRILEAFAKVKSLLMCLGEVVHSIRTTNHEYLFDDAGKFRGIIFGGFPGACLLPNNLHCVQAASDCEFIEIWVKGLIGAQAEADAALAEMPNSLQDVLPWSEGRPWRVAVRQSLIDQVLKWPGETDSAYSGLSRKVTPHVKTFLEWVGWQDPRDRWLEFVKLIDRYTEDLLSVRGEIPDTPRWDSTERCLWFRGQLICQYSRNAKVQIPLLQAFEDAGWPDEMPSIFKIKSKLEETVKDVNKKIGAGKPIKFRSLRDGEVAGWSRHQPSS